MRLRMLASWPVIIAIISAMTLSVVWAASSPIDDPYSSANTDWNGTSQLATLGLQTVTSDLSRALLTIDGPSALLIIGPSKAFTEPEANSIKEFLLKGGVLLVADNFGSGNSLLEHLMLPVRFEGRLVVDPLFYRKQPVFPIIFDFASSPFSIGVGEILLNYATALKIPDERQVSVLARSSPFSFLDSNGNLQKNREEPKGPFPVLATFNVGEGVVLLFTSPASLANGLIDESDNALLIRNIIRQADQDERIVLLDQTHQSSSMFTPVRLLAKDLVNAIVEGGMPFWAKIGLTGVAAAIISARYLYRKSSLQPRREIIVSGTAEEVDIDGILQRHPSWDRRKLEYVKQELEASRRWRRLNEGE